MTTRATLRQDLLAAVDPLGFHAGRIDLPLLWPAVKTWLLDPATDVTPSEDERNFYLSNAPGDGTHSFAGTPPAPIAGRDLICIELGRELRIRDRADVGLVLWYADGPAWEPLSTADDWIAVGPGTPHIDAFINGDNPSWLTTYIETSLAFAVASQQRALAVEIADGVADNLVVLAAATVGPGGSDRRPRT
jgi:hypothetical protein